MRAIPLAAWNGQMRVLRSRSFCENMGLEVRSLPLV